MLDNRRCAGAILMGLSKAFDTINHELLQQNDMPMVLKRML